MPRLSNIRVLCRGFAAGACALVAWVAPVDAGSPKHEPSPAPAAVCFPVEGTGYVVPHEGGPRIPVGSLSPLSVGDSLIVETGTITVRDFRTGDMPVYGAGSRVRIQDKDKSDAGALERIREAVLRGLSRPEQARIGGAVRDTERSFAPDGMRFAPDVPVLFEWSAAMPPPAALHLTQGEWAEDLSVDQNRPGPGVLVWNPGTAVEGRIDWQLFDVDGDSLGGSHLVVLSQEASARERDRFLNEARALVGDDGSEFVAAILAKADGALLW